MTDDNSNRILTTGAKRAQWQAASIYVATWCVNHSTKVVADFLKGIHSPVLTDSTGHMASRVMDASLMLLSNQCAYKPCTLKMCLLCPGPSWLCRS